MGKESAVEGAAGSASTQQLHCLDVELPRYSGDPVLSPDSNFWFKSAGEKKSL